jgi:DNA-binding IclR family transcriptional regulator
MWLGRNATEPGGRQLAEIAAGAGLDKATTHRMLRSLIASELVQQDRVTHTYGIGRAALVLAGAAKQSHAFLGWAAPAAELLATTVDETISLSERRGLEYVTIHEIEGTQVVRYANKVGRSSGLHVAAGGLAILAWSPPAVIEEVLASPLQTFTTRTVNDPNSLRIMLKRIRNKGFAHSFGQRHEGVHSVSIPLLGGDGYAVGSASLIWPTRGPRVDKERIQAWPALLQATFGEERGQGQEWVG